jgi:hypothetical protein
MMQLTSGGFATTEKDGPDEGSLGKAANKDI